MLLVWQEIFSCKRQEKMINKYEKICVFLAAKHESDYHSEKGM